MTKGNGRRRSKQELGAEALTELKEGRATPAARPDWSDRRPLRFWQPFNDWWRSELDRLGRRPNAQEINAWYDVNAFDLWKEDAPSLQETRVHAKCLRSLPLVRDYFRNYRAKKRSVGERVGPVRQRKKGRLGDRKSGSFLSGDDYVYDKMEQEDGDEGEGEGEPDEGEDEYDDMSGGGHDPDLQQDASMDADTDGAYLMGGLGLDMESYMAARDPATAAALAQLASLRGGAAAAAAAAAAGLPLELLHPAGMPALQSFLNPSAAAAALWQSAAAAQQAVVLDGPQSDLIRNLALQQLQHAAALQHHHHHHHNQQQAHQQALAALAQNLALSRAAGMGVGALQGFSPHAAAASALLPHASALASVLDGDERRALDEQFRLAAAAEAASGLVGAAGERVRYDQEPDEGEDEDEDEVGEDGEGAADRGGAGGALDFMEQVAQQAANLGRGKRKRGPGLLGRRQEYDMEEEEEAIRAGGRLAGDAGYGTDTEVQPGPSGRSGGGGGGGARRSGGAAALPQGPRQRRGTSKGSMPVAAAAAAVAVKPVALKRPPPPSQATVLCAGPADSGPAAAATGSGGDDGKARSGGAGSGRDSDGERRAGGGGALAVAPFLPLDALPVAVAVPPALRLEPVPRETLRGLSHDELVERVMLLQAHVLLLTQQRQVLLQRQHAGSPPPPAPERRTPPALAAAARQHGGGTATQQQQAQSQSQPPGSLATKLEEQATPLPTPVRPDTSPAKAATRRSGGGSGLDSPVPAELQRTSAGASPQGGDSDPPATARSSQQHHQQLWRNGEGRSLPVKAEAEATAISVLADILKPAPAASSAAAAPKEWPRARSGGGACGGAAVGRGAAAEPERSPSDGDSVLPEVAAALDL